MKKIMFNDQLGLTQSVLEGCKTQTRRIVPPIPCYAVKVNGKLKYLFAEDLQMRGNTLMLFINNEWHEAPKQSQPKYNIGEIVAVAQSYNEIWNTQEEDFRIKIGMQDEYSGFIYTKFIENGGWNNKMFVAANLMPHRIRITDIRVERMQEISDEDCLKEGVVRKSIAYTVGDYLLWDDMKRQRGFDTLREAFAVLIDNVSVKGTWDKNPWVFVYEFELVK